MADGEPFLKKVYYRSCPGCKADQRKEVNRGLPLKDFLFIWIVTLCAALPVSSLYPFLYFMIRDFHIAKKEQDIGFYAGLLGSSFMFGRAFTSLFWGKVADRIGRKIVIIIGTISVVIFNTLFGLSTNFWMAIVSRFLLGSLNCLVGPIKAYASEVCREEHQALAMSMVSTSNAVGLIIGPALGGFLAQPAQKYPRIFSEVSLFGRFPYFLPCFCISIIALAVTIACIWLPETLHMNHEISDTLDSHAAEEDMEKHSGKEADKSLTKNWPLMSSIIAYCVFSLHNSAYTEIFSLWAVSDRKYGGLSFSSQDVGQVLAISGLGVFLFQIWLYPLAQRILGPVGVCRLSGVLSVPLLSSYPYMATMSGFLLVLVINCSSVIKNILSVSVITGMYILQSNAVPQHQRGAAHGLSMTAMSLFKAAGPACGGLLFSWAQKRQLASFFPGDHMVFFSLNVVQLLGFVMTFKPFLATGQN